LNRCQGIVDELHTQGPPASEPEAA